MNIPKQRKRIDAALAIYREKLDQIPDDAFAETPPGGGWSYAEVYSHILKATLSSSIAMERCTYSNCEPTKKGLNVLGKFMMLTGSFPPVRIKVPEAVNAKTPVEKITKEEAKNLIIKCRRRMDDTVALIEASSKHSRYKHPRLGMLNARQWFKFIGIHLYHHIRQLQRIQNKFARA